MLLILSQLVLCGEVFACTESWNNQDLSEQMAVAITNVLDLTA